jgi:hypothetical protein
MNLFSRLFLSLFIIGSFVLAGCDSTNSNEDPEPLEAILVEDLEADPITEPPVGGPPVGTRKYTFFSLRENEVVLNYSDANRADSNSTEWDIAFSATNIIINGGTSGPGEGGAVIVEDVFDEVTTAPDDDEFRVDGESECLDEEETPGPSMAICPGDEHPLGWYNYTGQMGNPPHAIFPIPGRTIVVRTADGRYAKLRILNYYQGNPDPSEVMPGEEGTVDRYYTFEYVFQEDGSHDLTSEE